MKKAFTLAEVLITLTIIGVIAALTIPNLMQKWQDHADVVKVKEAYSIIDNALKMAIGENGPIDNWAFPENNNDRGVFFGEMIKPYLKISENCTNNKAGNCFNHGYITGSDKECPNNGTFCNSRCRTFNDKECNFSWNPHQSATSFRLNNDMRLFKIGFNTIFSAYNGNDQFYDNFVIVDINGTKKPNRLGYDVFMFGITKNGLTPKACEFWDSRKITGCSINNDVAWSGCSCAFWVLKHGNMDYKYRDISAEW